MAAWENTELTAGGEVSKLACDLHRSKVIAGCNPRAHRALRPWDVERLQPQLRPQRVPQDRGRELELRRCTAFLPRLLPLREPIEGDLGDDGRYLRIAGRDREHVTTSERVAPQRDRSPSTSGRLRMKATAARMSSCWPSISTSCRGSPSLSPK